MALAVEAKSVVVTPGPMTSASRSHSTPQRASMPPTKGSGFDAFDPYGSNGLSAGGGMPRSASSNRLGGGMPLPVSIVTTGPGMGVAVASPPSSGLQTPTPSSAGGASSSVAFGYGSASGSSKLKASPSAGNLSGSAGAVRVPSTMSIIEYKDCRFVLMDAPTNVTLPTYIPALVDKGVHNLVRCCEPSYDIDPLTAARIAVHECYFPDGDGGPSPEVIVKWLSLLESVFGRKDNRDSVAVHCVAGLGRAPVMVAIALIERCGVKPLDAITYIRKKRKGAFNSKQLDWLEHYQKQTGGQDNCAVM